MSFYVFLISFYDYKDTIWSPCLIEINSIFLTWSLLTGLSNHRTHFKEVYQLGLVDQVVLKDVANLEFREIVSIVILSSVLF